MPIPISARAATTRSTEATRALPSRERDRGQLLDDLRRFLETHRMADKTGPRAFADFERTLHERMMQLERDLIADEMRAVDIDADAIVIEGKTYRRVLKSAQTYMTAAGPVEVERWLHKDRSDVDARTISPMDKRLGIVDEFWTPRAAEQALWVVTQMTPKKAEELFERMGAMQPSKSSLDRLPKTLSERWEDDRESFEATLRDALVVPEHAVSVAVSIDGVMAPMEGTHKIEKQNQAAEDGRIIKGQVGYREVGCATLSFCDAKGDLIAAVRMARAPEANKRTVKASLAEELTAALRKRPELRVVKIADAVEDNWTFLADELPAGVEVIDFFHATEHLHAAVAAAYGDGTRETRHRYEILRDTLRDDPGGVEKVIRALKHLATKHPRGVTITRSLNYFRKHRHRMQYQAVAAEGLMIGSGVVEAACKTLVTQRLKLSGMYWGRGAQAILTPRGWDQSERFNEAWALLAATYHANVTVLANVIALRPPRPPKTPRRTTSG